MFTVNPFVTGIAARFYGITDGGDHRGASAEPLD